MRIKRKVIKIENYINPHANGTGGSNSLFLECGHVVRRKFSQGVPNSVYCRECEDWSSGKISFSQTGNIVETWDSTKQMPVFTEVSPDEDLTDSICYNGNHSSENGFCVVDGGKKPSSDIFCSCKLPGLWASRPNICPTCQKPHRNPSEEIQMD